MFKKGLKPFIFETNSRRPDDEGTRFRFPPGGSEGMAVPSFGSHIAPESLRLMLLAYGKNHSYRIVSIEDIAHAFPHVRMDEVKSELGYLAQQGLVTRFSGRYCFNRSIPLDLQHSIEQLITPSGTIRKAAN